MRRVYVFLTLALVVGPLSGCDSGDGLPRLAVSGTVSLGGTPVKDGTIQFSPVDPNMKHPVTGGAPIIDGKYAIAKDVGLVPGAYTVSIFSASSVIEPGETPGSAKALPKEAIPAKYNTQSTLKAEVKSGSTTFDFQLEN